MRVCIIPAFAVLCLASAAQAQMYPLEDLIKVSISLCVNKGGSPQFCDCKARRWVSLWTEQDTSIWRQTGFVTPHMMQMEAEAARQCSAG